MSEAISMEQVPEAYIRTFDSENALRILLLEDMPSDAALIKLELRKLQIDWEVVHVTNRLDFEEKFESYKPHFILSDYNLPQYTGMEAVKMVRNVNPYIPFIICTGRLNEETAVACIHAGADDYVLKDSLGRLSSSVMSALENKKNLIEKEAATKDLKKSEESFRALAENAPDSIYQVARNGSILYVNRDVDAITHEAMLGTIITEYVPRENHEALLAAIDLTWTSKKNQTVEIEGNINDDQARWYTCRIGPVLKGGHVESLILIPSDITEKKKAENELKYLNERLHELTQHLETIRDEEKKRISMEIHDQLGQELTGHKLGLYWIQQHLKQNGQEGMDLEAVSEKLASLVELNTQTIKTVRRIAHELRPVVLDNIGLIPALEWHIDNYNSNHETQAHLNINVGNANFEKDLSTALYRITQETLTNINRHAQASNAYINFYKTEEHLMLEVRDDGVGIDLEKAKKSKSLGLFGIRERIKKWDGHLEMEGIPGKGTSITVSIDLKNI
jgi:two-component system sensor histidine kinase UhpB